MLLAVCTGVVGTGAPAAGAAVPPRTLAEKQIDLAVFTLINTERLLHGLPLVRRSNQLELSARRHNLTMARFNQMSHQLPREPYFGRRILNAGYRWDYAGENIAWNSVMTKGGALLLQRLMYNERPPADEHRQNILSRNYRNVGVDVYFDRKHHKLWLTTDFGHHM